MGNDQEWILGSSLWWIRIWELNYAHMCLSTCILKLNPHKMFCANWEWVRLYLSLCFCCVKLGVMGHQLVRALQWYAVSMFSRNTDVKGSVLVCVSGWWIGLWSPGAIGHNPAKCAQTHLAQIGHFRVSNTVRSQRKYCFIYFVIIYTTSSTSKFYIYDSPCYLVMYATAKGQILQCLACQCQTGFHLWKLMHFFFFLHFSVLFAKHALMRQDQG